MSLLVSLQQQCANRLQSDPLFANVPVLTERIANIQSEINTALGPLGSGATGKTGLVAIVLTPTADVNFDNLFGPFFDDIRIDVRIVENVTINEDPANGTNVAASDAAEKVCSLLHLFQPDNANGPVLARKPSIALRHDHASQNLIYECRFRTSGGLTSILSQAATPAIADTSGVVTLTCATSGAAIFYTLDGSSPSPRNGTLYTAPFTPGTGLTLNARAWLAGYLTSNTATATT
jgi:Chitobiase/beta-hexosaminidase C-terminal domain